MALTLYVRVAVAVPNVKAMVPAEPVSPVLRYTARSGVICGCIHTGSKIYAAGPDGSKIIKLNSKNLAPLSGAL